MRLLFFTAILIVGFISIFMAISARAEDCPKGVKSCQVLIVTPEEIATMTQPGGIFDLAIWANRSGMEGLVQAWKKKIEMAPQGTVKADEPAK